MSVDIRRCSKQDLDAMNREIAICKAARNPGGKPKAEVCTNSDEPEKSKPDHKAEQLNLWGGGL
jgi:hypothetical protein